MTQRYFIYFSYDGAAYHGWQVQPNAVTVQQMLEEALATILRVPVPVVGAGRTDTGVNAECMVDHADLLLAAYDGKPGGTAGTIAYAKRRGVKVLRLPPDRDPMRDAG